MTMILTAYVYTTSPSKPTIKARVTDRGTISTEQFKSAQEFDIDYDVPILLSHKELVNAQVVSARYDEKGMLADILVKDDALAESIVGFSVGYTIGSQKQRRMTEISLTGPGHRPGNDDCVILKRVKADPTQAALAKWHRSNMIVVDAKIKVIEVFAKLIKEIAQGSPE